MAKRKAPTALVDVPQDTVSASARIARIGELRRELARRATVLHDAIAVVTAEHAEAMKPLQAELAQAEAAVQAFCEGRRAALTQGNKVKFYRFDAGEVSWRTLPPAVSIRDAKRVVAHCLANKKLQRFLRFAEPKPDKEAMLKEPEVATAIPGVSIGSAGETFEIAPHELQLERGAA